MTEAPEIFLRFKERFERGETLLFEDLLAAHPAHVNELRRLHADWILSSDAPAANLFAIGEGRLDELGWSRLLSRLAVRGAQLDRYERRGEIGRGGMGVVREIYDRDLLRSLAMKTMRTDRGLGSGSTPRTDPALSRLLEEAQVTAQLDHPGVVPVHEVGIDDEGQVYFTMKLVAGEDLGDVFDKLRAGLGDWTLPRVVGVLARVTEAVSYAHDKRVIHRDLKPSNVRVGRYGEVYVMDWGLARILEEDAAGTKAADLDRARSHRRDAVDDESPLHTMEGDLLGTPSYMSPEQALGAGAHVGVATDIYAFGAMLYELLVGAKPYAADGASPPREIVARLLEGPPRPIAEVAPGAPPELIAICERAMHREPAGRYPSMRELGDDLRAYLEGRVVRAYATGALAELKKWVVRNRKVAIAAAIAVISVVGGASLVAWRENVAKAAIAKERDEVLRLADARRVEELRRRADALWPPSPEHVDEFERWLRDARDLESRVELHRMDLMAIRGSALPLTEAESAADYEGSPEYGEVLNKLGLVAASRHGAYQQEFFAVKPNPGVELSSSREERAVAIAKHEKALLAAQRVEAPRRAWKFADDEQAWRHDTLSRLVETIESLTAKEPAQLPIYSGTSTIGNMERRLEFARKSIEADAMSEGAWKAAIAEIANVAVCPAYGGLVIARQRGLEPLGRDSESNLFEFFVTATGEAPRRGENGRFIIEPETAIILALLPGGSFFLGSQPIDSGAPNYDLRAMSDEGPVVSVVLDPFFMSKYEVTQAQWQRLIGANPSVGSPTRFPRDSTWTNPVECVSWTDCDVLLRRLGLEIPTEAQWEYAARAGARTRWWTGDSSASISGAANLLDQSYAREISDSEEPEPFDDGFDLHSPVGTFRPNPFGLHDTMGNVWEWCRDHWGFYTDTPRSGDGLRLGRYTTDRVNRGGAYQSLSTAAAPCYRASDDEHMRQRAIGIRPSKRLDERRRDGAKPESDRR